MSQKAISPSPLTQPLASSTSPSPPITQTLLPTPTQQRLTLAPTSLLLPPTLQAPISLRLSPPSPLSLAPVSPSISQARNCGIKDGYVALQKQPTLQEARATKADSDVEARVNHFMQTTGRGLQGQYWRRSAYELSKWLTAQIQYERQGWQLKLQTALNEIENYRREALIADKILTDSLEALLNCLHTCSINYSHKMSSLNNNDNNNNSTTSSNNKKKSVFIEYVELLTEVVHFFIEERLQCLCLMERKPDIKVNLVECMQQFLAKELQQMQYKAIRQQQELGSIISELEKDRQSFQNMLLYTSWITAGNKLINHSNGGKNMRKKYSIEPTVSSIWANSSNSNGSCSGGCHSGSSGSYDRGNSSIVRKAHSSDGYDSGSSSRAKQWQQTNTFEGMQQRNGCVRDFIKDLHLWQDPPGSSALIITNNKMIDTEKRTKPFTSTKINLKWNKTMFMKDGESGAVRAGISDQSKVGGNILGKGKVSGVVASTGVAEHLTNIQYSLPPLEGLQQRRLSN